MSEPTAISMVARRKQNASVAGAIRIVPVKRNNKCALALYDLLKQRRRNISHQKMPSYEAHKAFVFSHPYRVWYFVEAKDRLVGAIYILKSNSIGVSMSRGYERHAKQAIDAVLNKHKPLPEIKSVRAAEFSINVSPSNVALQAAIKKLGGELAQLTYRFKPLR